jgi:hypothetical protein
MAAAHKGQASPSSCQNKSFLAVEHSVVLSKRQEIVLLTQLNGVFRRYRAGKLHDASLVDLRSSARRLLIDMAGAGQGVKVLVRSKF